MTEVRHWFDIAMAAFVIELRRMTTNRSAVVVSVLMPAAIATLIGIALGSVGTDTVRLGFVDQERGAISQAFQTQVLGELRNDPRVEVSLLSSEAVARREAQRRNIGAAFVVTRDAATAGVKVIDGKPLDSALARTIAESFGLRTRAALLTGSTSGLRGPSVTFSSPGGRRLSAATYWGPALGGFLVLLGLGYGAQRLVSDRTSGVRDRLLAAPGGGSGPLVGQTAAGVAVGAAGLVVLVVVSTTVVGQSWGPPTSVVSAILATAVAVTGVAVLVAGLARTPGRAQTLTALVAFALAIGGGSFSTPSSSLGPRGLAVWLPTAQSLEAFSRTITNHASPPDLLGPLLVLTATGLICGTVGLALEKRLR